MNKHLDPLSPRERGRGEGRISKLPLSQRAKDNARRLRGSLTDAEEKLWFLLRDRRFLGLKFRRQHPVPPYVLDFYCEELKLGVELDGGQHNEGAAIKLDGDRSAVLRQRGIVVVRYWNDEFLKRTPDVMQDLSNRVESLRRTPSSGAARHLLPRGEGNSL